MNEIKNHWRRWLYWFVLGVAIIIVYKALDNFTNIIEAMERFFSIISPFFIGVFIAYLIYMPCSVIENKYKKNKIKFIRKRSRGLSILTVYVIILILILILFRFILPVVFESVSDLISNAQQYYETAIQKYNEIPEDSILKTEILNDSIQNIKNIDIKQYFKLDNILNYIISALNAVTSLLEVFVAIIVSIYILMERTQIINFLKKLANAIFKDTVYKNIDKYFNNSNEIFFKFIASQFLDAIIVGILVSIALSIMKIKYAPLLGFFIGLFNMIPYIGAIIAVGISAFITLITGGISQAVWMLIVVIVLQQVDANIINPKIIGKSLKISPLLVIFAVTIGGAYFGIFGMFVAVPVIAVLKIFIEDYVDYKLRIKNKNVEC